MIAAFADPFERRVTQLLVGSPGAAFDLSYKHWFDVHHLPVAEPNGRVIGLDRVELSLQIARSGVFKARAD